MQCDGNSIVLQIQPITFVGGQNFICTWLSGKLSYESKIIHMLEVLGFRLVGNRKIAVTTNLTWLTQALGLEIINLMQKTTNKKD